MEEKDRMMQSKIRNIALCICFLVIIFGIGITTIVGEEKGFSDNENRILQGKPEFSIEALMNGEYTAEYETYVSDQFMMRDQWIALKVYTERAMQKKDINGVYFGDDGYLLQQHRVEDIDVALEQKNIEILSSVVEKYKDRLDVKVMIVPTASNILEDKMPKYVTDYNQDAFIDQVTNRIGKEYMIDVRPILSTHSDEYIYYRTDHHWTSLGAFYAYQQWSIDTGHVVKEAQEYDITQGTNEFYGTLFSKVNIAMKTDCIDLYKLKEDFA